MLNKAVMFGTMGIATASLTYNLSAFEYYSVQNTNAMSMFLTAILHLSLVMGPAALWAQKYCLNYHLFPGSLWKVPPESIKV